MAQPVRILHPSRVRRGQGPVADHRGTEGLRGGPELCELDPEPGRVAGPVAARVGRLHRGTAARARAARDGRSRPGRRQTKKPTPQIERESWRLLANLERLDAATRVKIGDEVTRRLRRDEDNVSLLWSIGRLGARTPIYGPLTSVVAPSDAGRWLEGLAAHARSTPERFAAIVQIGTVTGDSQRDLDELVLDAARQRLRDAGVEPDQARPLYEIVTATFADTSRAFGEPLPNGLRLGDAGGSGPSTS